MLLKKHCLEKLNDDPSILKTLDTGLQCMYCIITVIFGNEIIFVKRVCNFYFTNPIDTNQLQLC